MQYRITQKENKTASTGTAYVSATLEDDQGIEYKVNAFNGEFAGDTYEGTLEQNGKFWNLPKLQRTKPNSYVKKDPLVLEEKRNENIKANMKDKEASIAYFNSRNTALSFVEKYVSNPQISGAGEALEMVQKYTEIFYKDWEKWNDAPFH